MTDDATDRMGILSETPAGWRLAYRRRLDRRPAVAWRAFTDPELLRTWFPTTIEGDLVAGAPLTYTVIGFDREPFRGSVLEIDEPHLLVLAWGDDVLRFELSPTGDATELTLTVQIGELGRAARDGAGWHECLDKLAAGLATEPGTAPVETWDVIHPRYVERLGPDAATVGPPPEVLDARRR